MNCKGVIREISNYIDGDLDAGARQELEHHLAGCGDCELVINQTRKMIEIFCDSKPVALPDDVSHRLHAALQRKIAESQK